MNFSNPDELAKFLDNLNSRTADLCARKSTVPPRHESKREEETVCYKIKRAS
jgi:hypothetical protein